MIIFFDLETTGLDKSTAEIVEIYAKVYEPDSTSPREFHKYALPSYGKPVENAYFHGYSREVLHLKYAVSQKECLKEFKKWLDKQMETLIGQEECFLVGYNSFRYDFIILHNLCNYYGIQFETDKLRFSDVYYVLKHSSYKKMFNNLQLRTVYENLYQHIPDTEYHHANFDTLILSQIYEYFKNLKKVAIIIADTYNYPNIFDINDELNMCSINTLNFEEFGSLQY